MLPDGTDEENDNLYAILVICLFGALLASTVLLIKKFANKFFRYMYDIIIITCRRRCIEDENNASTNTSVTSNLKVPWNHRIKIDALKIFEELKDSDQNFKMSMTNMRTQTESFCLETIIEVDLRKTLELPLPTALHHFH